MNLNQMSRCVQEGVSARTAAIHTLRGRHLAFGAIVQLQVSEGLVVGSVRPSQAASEAVRFSLRLGVMTDAARLLNA